RDVRLLDCAIRLEDWEVAPLLCITLDRWYGEHGRLHEMQEVIEQLLPHATGMERIVLRGHLVTIATNQGDYRTGLTENEQLEAELQAFQDDDDYVRNLQATITQQIDVSSSSIGLTMPNGAGVTLTICFRNSPNTDLNPRRDSWDSSRASRQRRSASSSLSSSMRHRFAA